MKVRASPFSSVLDDGTDPNIAQVIGYTRSQSKHHVPAFTTQCFQQGEVAEGRSLSSLEKVISLRSIFIVCIKIRLFGVRMLKNFVRSVGKTLSPFGISFHSGEDQGTALHNSWSLPKLHMLLSGWFKSSHRSRIVTLNLGRRPGGLDH